ncbi:MAG: PIG-L deacetylase family protein [Pirellulaceae bacterium]
MFDFLFRRTPVKSPRFLFLGAHPDDIEIGAGGTIQRLLQCHPTASVVWVVLSGNVQRAAEAKSSATAYLSTVLEKRILVETFRDGYFPYQGEQIKDFFETLKREIDPDLILTHYRDDRHQDHRVVSDLTWNTFRAHSILEYEIPKYDGDLGQPNMYVALNKSVCESKVHLAINHFTSQTTKHWFTRDTLYSLLRLRGMETGSHYAEAFYSRKLVVASTD